MGSFLVSQLGKFSDLTLLLELFPLIFTLSNVALLKGWKLRQKKK